MTGTTRIGDPADPEGIEAQTLRIDKMTIGGAVFSGVTGVTWEGAAGHSSETRGVVGLSIFSDVLLTIDYPKREVRLSRGALSAAEPGVVAYTLGPEGIVRIPVTVGSTAIEADLDTGSPATISLPKHYADELPLEGKLVQVGRGQTVGGEFAIYSARAKGEVRIGTLVLDSSLEFHERLPVANVGYRTLRAFAVTIDQKNQRVRFAAAAAPPATARASAESGHSGYTGRYGVRTIELKAGKLYLQREGGPLLELVPAGADEFTLVEIPAARIRFVRDANGKVSELEVLNRDGQWEKSEKEAP